MEIVELEKPFGVRCVYQRAGGGCTIYPERPPSCRAFSCAWLLDPSMPHRMRPDQCKVVLDIDSGGKRMIARCDPSNPLAWKRQPMYGQLKTWAREGWAFQRQVVAIAGRHIWAITPREDLDMGEVDPRSPFAIFERPDGTFGFEIMPPIPDSEMGDP